ncbi:MAG: UDP-N-acetylglucosamine 1-carboxyvinyltransferase [Candidatus Omnitrophica bacterium]|nr:UDP-N-acetylglucosamine 1-carboxyvinyltransferase [Candidatus Omnitrophota bacterium]
MVKNRLIIEGGRRLKGEVKVGSAKNAILPIIAASLLTDKKVVLKNISLVSDVLTMLEILKAIGSKIEIINNNLIINNSAINSFSPPDEIVKKIRASYYLISPLLARFQKVKIAYPGGCEIGKRPIDLHIKGLMKLGAKIILNSEYLEGELKDFIGSEIYLYGYKGPSLGATCQILLAACKAKGKTVIFGASCEPEVIDLVNFLKKMGAEIYGEGTPVIEIYGKEDLTGCEYEPIPDRIEVGTFLCAGLITNGEITIKNVIPKHLEIVLQKLKEAGADLAIGAREIKIKRREKELKPLNIITSFYPGFPTDLQAQFTTLACLAKGESIICENIFEKRFAHCQELKKMGADIEIINNKAIIKGKEKLIGSEVNATDLRASASLVLAGLVAEGETVINNSFHLDRGYYQLEKKLATLGAQISRI